MKNYKYKTKQEGVALAIGIILLLVIAVIGVTSMKSALLQEKMSGGLARKGYADTAAYTLLVAVENYLFRIYENNNGVETLGCSYCGDEFRGAEWYGFISQKNMNIGSKYPHSLSLINELEGNLHDEPKFIVYSVEDDTPGLEGRGKTKAESIGGAAGSSSGALGDSKEGSIMNYYKIASKANDSTGNTFVIYESVFAMRQN